MTDICALDFETRSRCDLKSAGAWRYSEDPSTTILCLAYQIPGQPVAMWVDGEPPEDLVEYVEAGGLLEAHHAAFEIAIWHNILVKRYGWLRTKFSQWRDTMAAAAYKAMPLKLEKATSALRLQHQKDMDGNRLLNKPGVSKPRKPTKNNPNEWVNDKEVLDRVSAYCRQDVRAEGELSERLGPLPPEEQRVWQLDQKINARGVRIDQDLCHAAIKVGGEYERRNLARLQKATQGKVETGRQVAAILEWCAQEGYDLPNLQAETVETALSDKEAPESVREVLRLRQKLAKSSAAKYGAALACVCQDGRARGLLQYHGAATGRWAGRLIQPQNFRRPQLGHDMDTLADLIKTEDFDFIEAVAGDLDEVLADAVRGIIISEDDTELCAGDFTAIEAVVLASIAEEDWKLEAFRRREDIYCLTASQIFGREITEQENPDERQVGKTCELAFGFGGGVSAWRAFDRSEREDSEIEGYRDAWRERHPGVRAVWDGLNRACVAAVARPGQAYEYAGVEYLVEGEWLSCRLPSGRKIWYYGPKISHEPMPWDEEDIRPQVLYWAWKEGQWKQVRTYGGKLTENVVQAVARDIMVHAMLRAEKEGYPIVLTVHDEIVSERVDPDPIALKEIMGDLPWWAAGYPINAKVWRGRRYRK